MKQSLNIGIVVTIQLIATFTAQLLVIRMVGVGHETDAYIAAQSLPAVLFAIISTALQSVWLPKLAILNKNFTEWRNQQSIAQSQALLLGGVMYLFVWLTRGFWAKLLFPGFLSHQLELTTLLVGPLLVAAGFNTQTSLLIIALRARSLFVVGELISMLGTVVSLLLMIMFIPHYGIESAAWIATLRAVLVFLMLYGIAGWPRVKLKVGIAQRDTWKQMCPILFGATIYKTSPLIDRFWISQAPIGSMTIFGLAQTAMSAISTIMEKVISMPLTPTMARYVAENDYAGLKKIYLGGLKHVSIGVLLVFSALIVVYPIFADLMRLVIISSPETAMSIWLMLVLLLGYLYGAISGSILVAVFYALGDMKTPMHIGVIGFLLGVALKSLGFIFFGLYGLVAGTSVYYLVNALFMYFILEKKIVIKLP
ncbi:MAG: lipid II flippase MurJ [Methylotenera sp.]|uniref:lipid II flippase MurJ n=1 Tax=Methylotenera sp. TaxID=2051956 RepID=UPI0024877D10|nr:lipid II flippase MurJ [Methylotenera sp.]MDI1307816.1 lipid II flippase MurJ [Methylotenera sp.]